jgi:hypothetical protein
MIIEPGEKIHIITRRYYEADIKRHFLGVVLAVEGAVVRVEGYVFVLEEFSNKYVKRQDKRIRIFGLADGMHIINVIHPNADIEHVRYSVKDNRLTITDGETFSLDINEFGSKQ